MSTCDSTKSLVPCSQDSLQVPFQNELKLRNLDLGHCTAENNLTNASVSIENSSEVVIGPVTHYHIHIPEDATQRKNETEVEDTGKKEEQKTEKKERFKQLFQSTKSLKLLLVALAIVAVALVAVTVSLLPKHEEIDPDEKPEGDYIEDLGKHKLVHKEAWGGFPSKNGTKPLPLPVKAVLISHTAGMFCTEFQKCCTLVRNIQSYHFGIKSLDIGYNFLIGGDGNVYVGRGWDIQNFHNDFTIGISFLGNYVINELTDKMIEAAQLLIQMGVKKGKIANNYVLLAHNQTYNTLSPGENIYKVIKTWPHFYQGTLYSVEDFAEDLK